MALSFPIVRFSKYPDVAEERLNGAAHPVAFRFRGSRTIEMSKPPFKRALRQRRSDARLLAVLQERFGVGTISGGVLIHEHNSPDPKQADTIM